MTGVMTEAQTGQKTDIRPFHFTVSDADLTDLRRRINATKWPERETVNDDTQGYHDTITRVFLHGIRLFLNEADSAEPLHELINELLLSPMGGREWPLRFYSRDRLLSVPARRAFLKPDIAALP